jgi:hypothetical protein
MCWIVTAAPFSRPWLESEGFVGFSTVSSLRDSRCAEVPKSDGVYVAYRAAIEVPVWLEISTGGRFKGKDPSVTTETLAARHLPEVPVVYIGKGDVLRRRIDQFVRFGAGAPIGHWGGRFVWQLADSDDLLIAWKTTHQARTEEIALLAKFESAFRRLPLANLQR